MEPKKTCQVIINPISGHGNRVGLADTISSALGSKFQVSVSFTEYAGHARLLAEEALSRGTEVVLAVGGDGTVNEIAGALCGTAAALGIIPRGSGNGLAYHLGIPRRIKKALDLVLNGEVRTIDTALFNGRTFCCSAGVGYDAKVAMDYSLSGHRGLATYTLKAVQDWFGYTPKSYKLTVDGHVFETKALLITVGNANQWGNNFHITPMASLNDGLLDLAAVHPINAARTVPMAVELLGYGIADDKKVDYLRGKEIMIETLDGSLMNAHFDGEPVSVNGPLCLSVVPSSLKIIA